MITRNEVELIAGSVIAEYFDEMFPLFRDLVSREVLGAAHCNAKNKAMKKILAVKVAEWSEI